MMFTVLKKCDVADPNIPQEVKDFYEQIKKDSFITKNNPFNLYVSEDNDHWYSLSVDMEGICIYVHDFGITNIKEAAVGVTYEDKPKQHIYASLGNVPRDEVGMKMDKLFSWIKSLTDNPNSTFLDATNCT